MSELVFLLSADIDIQNAYDFYEDCQEGRGSVFMVQLDAAFGRLRQFPRSGSVFHEQYRRLLIGEFPYAIFYTLEARGIIIAAGYKAGPFGHPQALNLVRSNLPTHEIPHPPHAPSTGDLGLR